jgi:hypothetical protein
MLTVRIRVLFSRKLQYYPRGGWARSVKFSPSVRKKIGTLWVSSPGRTLLCISEHDKHIAPVLSISVIVKAWLLDLYDKLEGEKRNDSRTHAF